MQVLKSGFFGLMTLVLVAGCAPARSQSEGAVSPSHPDEANAKRRSELTGSVSEAQFKALHELRKDAAPQLNGSALRLGDDNVYLSLPKVPSGAAIVVIHEWWGLNDHLRHWADRLAGEGYAALAVDLYGGTVATTPDEAMSAMKAVAPQAAIAKLKKAFAFLAEDDRVRAKKRAVIGWCFGGKWSLELALAEPQLTAAVLYYGHVTTEEARLATLQAPLLAIFGGRDPSIPESQVSAFENTLKKLGKQVSVARFDAEHAFANPSSARYDQKAAAAAWEQTKAFLASTLR